ncbi:MAG: putative sugar O-methyltransferase [Pseudomonadota bacterium]|nr:putative sugar O-methyltransferase [Pseudomonadota bacterium]
MSKKENLWELIKTKEVDSTNLNLDIATFRSIGGFNSKLASWDPLEKSSRYYKSLLFEYANYLDSRIIKSEYFKEKSPKKGDGISFFLKNIINRNLGSPTIINFEGCIVDIDYLLSCDEMDFIYTQLKNSNVVLEIGAGFGRLPHSIIQTFSNIDKYIIIDLDWMLKLSSIFLKKVLKKDQFKKIIFIDAANYKNDLKDIINVHDEKIDLTINIDSFQEMPTFVAEDYINYISNHSKSFFSKNAICKYEPDNINVKLKDDSQYEAALDMGLCKEVIDIFNSNHLNDQQTKYIEKYCPSGFINQKKEQCFGQFLYYCSAFYVKK